VWVSHQQLYCITFPFCHLQLCIESSFVDLELFNVALANSHRMTRLVLGLTKLSSTEPIGATHQVEPKFWKVAHFVLSLDHTIEMPQFVFFISLFTPRILSAIYNFIFAVLLLLSFSIHFPFCFHRFRLLGL
jgi:hypothetical protein